MKALEWIKQFKEVRDLAICGSYALNKLIGCEYNDIDVYTYLLYDCIETEGVWSTTPNCKDEVTLLGKMFKRDGSAAYKELRGFVSYKCTEFEDTVVNVLMFVKQHKEFKYDIHSMLRSFDFSILRCALLHDLEHPDIILEDCQRSIDTKVVYRGRLDRRFRTCHSPIRVTKYKRKLPDYDFVEEL